MGKLVQRRPTTDAAGSDGRARAERRGGPLVEEDAAVVDLEEFGRISAG